MTVRGDGVRPFTDDAATASIEDAGLFGGDADDGRPEELGMVHVDGGDDAEEGAFDDVGGVQGSAQAHLDDRQIGRGLGHGDEGRRRGAFEHRRLDAAHGLDPVEDGVELRVLDQLSGQPDPLIETDQMGRGIGVDPEAGRLGHGADEGDGRALAVGAGDMDDGGQAKLRIAEDGAEGAHTVQREVDLLRVAQTQAFGNRVHGAP
jgi:hypothetical protein